MVANSRPQELMSVIIILIFKNRNIMKKFICICLFASLFLFNNCTNQNTKASTDGENQTERCSVDILGVELCDDFNSFVTNLEKRITIETKGTDTLGEYIYKKYWPVKAENKPSIQYIEVCGINGVVEQVRLHYLGTDNEALRNSLIKKYGSNLIVKDSAKDPQYELRLTQYLYTIGKYSILVNTYNYNDWVIYTNQELVDRQKQEEKQQKEKELDGLI